MPQVSLSGQLICRDDDELTTVFAQLPRHIKLTRLEPGCISFEVSQTDNPLVWQVDELFANEDSFTAHQLRVSESEWGRATARIERRYVTQGLATD